MSSAAIANRIEGILRDKIAMGMGYAHRKRYGSKSGMGYRHKRRASGVSVGGRRRRMHHAAGYRKRRVASGYRRRRAGVYVGGSKSSRKRHMGMGYRRRRVGGTNRWIKHVKAYQRAHPHLSYAAAMVKARSSYRPMR